MYQFFYADEIKYERPTLEYNVYELYEIDGIRPTTWEEHCLECAAPECYGICPNYFPRKDGKCRLLYDGIQIFEEERALSGIGARVKFRRWGNLLSIIFPTFMDFDEHNQWEDDYQKVGNQVQSILDDFDSINDEKKQLMFETEKDYRWKLRGLKKETCERSDIFIFHGYSFYETTFNLVLEVFDKKKPLYRTSFELKPGENLIQISTSDLSEVCDVFNYLIKVYPENNIEAEIEIYWCNFVKGRRVRETIEDDQQKVKCVVWDLDNTIFDGVAADQNEGTDVNLKPGIREIIEELDSKGILQSIASKNEYDFVWRILKKKRLSKFFLVPQINWGNKSTSIEKIAKQLNIGIDSIAFFDDSNYERTLVKETLPQVRVYDGLNLNEVIRSAPFDVIVSSESSLRRKRYRDEEIRNAAKGKLDELSFLKKCNINVKLISIENDDILLRCYELVQRTNQLNMCGIRYEIDQFKEFARRYNSYALKCYDKFGEYGIVGYVSYEKINNVIEIREFVLSCRVACKQIESALFSGLLQKEKIPKGILKLNKTQKNVVLQNTLKDAGFINQFESDGKITYEFTSELNNSKIVRIDFEQEIFRDGKKT